MLRAMPQTLAPAIETTNGDEAVAPDIQVLKDKLKDLLRHASVSRLKIHTDSSAIETRELDSGFVPGRILGSNMVFILVSGDAIRVTFKVHFNIRTAKDLAFRIFGGESAQAISERQAIDYFKEYGNLVAGCVVTLLGELDIELGISLPLSTRGYYEIFSDYTEKRQPIITYSDFWELKANGYDVYCSALLELLNEKQLAGLVDHEIVEESGADDGEMDFL